METAYLNIMQRHESSFYYFVLVHNVILLFQFKANIPVFTMLCAVSRRMNFWMFVFFFSIVRETACSLYIERMQCFSFGVAEG